MKKDFSAKQLLVRAKTQEKKQVKKQEKRQNKRLVKRQTKRLVGISGAPAVKSPEI
jgi:hypothetical protein